MLEKHTKSEPVSIGQSEGDAHQIGQYQGKYVEQKKNEKNSVTIAKAICLLKLVASIESHTQYSVFCTLTHGTSKYNFQNGR